MLKRQERQKIRSATPKIEGVANWMEYQKSRSTKKAGALKRKKCQKGRSTKRQERQKGRRTKKAGVLKRYERQKGKSVKRLEQKKAAVS